MGLAARVEDPGSRIEMSRMSIAASVEDRGGQDGSRCEDRGSRSEVSRMSVAARVEDRGAYEGPRCERRGSRVEVSRKSFAARVEDRGSRMAAPEPPSNVGQHQPRSRDGGLRIEGGGSRERCPPVPPFQS